MTEMLQEALALRRQGLSVIPVSANKVPLLPWKEYQTRLPSEDEIQRWWTEHPNANIGMATGVVSGVAVIDVDTDEGKQIIKNYIPEDCYPPTVCTPKGGNHYYFRCQDKTLENNTRGLPGIDFRGNGGYVVMPPSVGEKGAYEWDIPMTPGEILPDIPQKYLELIEKRRMGSLVSGAVGNFEFLTMTYGERNACLFHLANNLFKGGSTEQFIYQTLQKQIEGAEPPISMDEIDKIVKSAKQRREGRERPIKEDVREWVDNMIGCEFTVSDCYRDLSLTLPQDKTGVRKTFLKLVASRVIAQTGKNGKYRLVDNGSEVIDLFAPRKGAVDIKLPLQLETLVSVRQKNVIVVAGVSNAGKTALLLNMVKDNIPLWKGKILYQSSEMLQDEFQERLSKFQDVPMEYWRGFTPVHRVENWSDAIEPDWINIIDYLEISEDFFKVGRFINDIFDRLNTGVAIIALQKNKGTEYGLGGARSIEKARLYLTLDPDPPDGCLCTIRKGKNRVNDEVNPDGMSTRFKLVGGSKIVHREPWERIGAIPSATV